MTREQAIAKVNKLLGLARGNSSPAEAESARRAVERLRAEHNISDDDLASSALSAAFDELLDVLDDHVKRSNVPLPVRAAIEMMRRTEPSNKANALKQFVKVLTTASLFVDVDAVMKVVDQTLKKHNVGDLKDNWRR